ncbi:hypothetical protein T484DRAFT_2628984 [Baffinella frigidus]|nr:hypothetical protein T484DRAFT_2628984 [Cryptophyta sp. CCMP2293]
MDASNATDAHDDLTLPLKISGTTPSASAEPPSASHPARVGGLLHNYSRVARDSAPFSMGGETWLAVAHADWAEQEGTSRGMAVVYRWNASVGYFVMHQELDKETGAASVEHMMILDRNVEEIHYLAVANSRVRPGRNGSVAVYRYVSALRKFLMHHNLTTPYALVAGQLVDSLGNKSATPPEVLKIPVSLAARTQYFGMRGSHYLAVAYTADVEGASDVASYLYRWNPGSLNPQPTNPKP